MTLFPEMDCGTVMSPSFLGVRPFLFLSPGPCHIGLLTQDRALFTYILSETCCNLGTYFMNRIPTYLYQDIVSSLIVFNGKESIVLELAMKYKMHDF